MDILSKNKFLTIIVAALIVVNVSLLLTIWYHYQPTGNEKIYKKDNEDAKITEFFKKELSFDKNQADSLKVKYKIYSEKIFVMKEEIRKLHNKLNYQVIENKSLNEINSEFDLLGSKKADLDKVSYQFFLDLRSLCRDDQKPVFDNLVKDIVKVINRQKENK